MSDVPAPYVVEREPVSPFDLSLTCMLVVVFLHSTSPSYPAAVQIARGATHFGVIGSGRGAMHIAGFEPTREDAARALALLNLVGDWRGVQIWSRGRQLPNDWTPRKVLDCFIAAASCIDWRAHCVATIDVARSDARAFPCRLAAPFFRFDRDHPSSYADQAQAAVVRQRCDWCPRFDPTLSGRSSSG